MKESTDVPGASFHRDSPRRTGIWYRFAQRPITVAAVLLAVSTATPSAHADAASQYLELSAGYKSGDFGTTTRSELYSLLPAWGYVADNFDYGLLVPLLTLSETTAGVSTAETGLGDVILRGGGRLWDGGESDLYGSLAVKLPTADDTAGLGTGAADLGAFLAYRNSQFDTPLRLYGGYIFVGERSGDSLNNVAVAGAGLSGHPGGTYLYGGLEARSASVHGVHGALEAQFGLLRALGGAYLFKLTAFTGFTDGGPDYGLTAGFVRWFWTGHDHAAELAPERRWR